MRVKSKVTFHLQENGDWQVRVSGLISGRIMKLSVGAGWQYRPRGHYLDGDVGEVYLTLKECMEAVKRQF